MIRRDYILRMIEEFIAALRRAQTFNEKGDWRNAEAALDEEFQRLIGSGAQAVAKLSETELLAKLMQGDSTVVLRDKTFMLVALLREAGELATAQNRAEEARACHLKALHLLMDILARGDADEYPEFVPKVEWLVSALQDAPLPPHTLALLMQHYERTGQFARAEDAFYSLLDLDPKNPRILEFGLAFFVRLQNQTDSALADGNLPRAELDASLAELRARKAALR